MEVIERSSSLADKAYHSILEAICEGQLSPGEKLTQEVIAERLKISRIPVAQALLTLKRQAFVEQNGRRSLFVTRPDPEFFSAIYQLRSALDPLSAQLAVKNVTPDSVVSCERILAAGERAANSGNVSKLVTAEMEFHMFIYRLSGNQLISEIMELYWNHLRRGIVTIYRTRAHRGNIWKEHAAIFKAIADGDSRHAKALALQHVQIASKVVPAALAELGNGVSAQHH
jgi:DNA-binding GntR family transcriptional regulator